MRVLPATLPRNRYNATKLDLRGMPKLVKQRTADGRKVYLFHYNKLRQTNQRQINERPVWS
jgi:hypothetical protein